MLADADRELIHHFFSKEDARRKRSLVLVWVLIIATDLLMLVAYFQTEDIGTVLLRVWPALVAVLTLVFFVLRGSVRSQRTMEARLNDLLSTVDLDWEDISELELPKARQSLVLDAFADKSMVEGQVNTAYRRTRGGDEKGPAFGEEKAGFEVASKRQDPAVHEADYEGLVGPLGTGEVLVEEANESYAAQAQERWEASEKADMDMIEAGVERLGDLVAAGWFEKNVKDGAVNDLMGTNHEDGEP
jgi:hypothetical protein